MMLWRGDRTPLRALEFVAVWKSREAAGAALIRGLVPGLEPGFVRTLRGWEALFARTADTAQTILAGRGAGPVPAGGPETRAEPAEEDSASLAGTDPADPANPAVPADPASPQDPANPPADAADDAFHLARAALYQSREFVRQLELLRAGSAALRGWPAADAAVRHIGEESERFQEEADRWIEEFRSYRGAPEEEPHSLRSPREPGDAVFVPVGGHTLPPLPYPYNALEPYIDERTMRIHHDRHHRAYVEGLNLAEQKLEEARRTGHFDLVKHWERELAFNGAGHYLHTLFWETMSPNGGGRPKGELARHIERDFGGFDAFRRQFSAAAEKVEGGGWAILVWSPRSRRLEILTAEKHQNLSQWDVVPLLPLDVWEHAYYLKHQNNRAAYIRDWWHVVNWPAVEKRFARAQGLRWSPPA